MADKITTPVPVPIPNSPATPAPTTAVESDEKFFAALGYFAFLFIIPLVVKPKSTFCKFHARQSMVMFLGTIVVLIILGVIPWFGSLLTLAVFALYVLAIYKAYNGEMWNIPLVSIYANKMDLEKMYGKAGVAMGSISGMKEKATQMASDASAAAKNLGKQEEAPKAPEQPVVAAAEPSVPPTVATPPAPQTPATSQTPPSVPPTKA